MTSAHPLNSPKWSHAPTDNASRTSTTLASSLVPAFSAESFSIVTALANGSWTHSNAPAKSTTSTSGRGSSCRSIFICSFSRAPAAHLWDRSCCRSNNRQQDVRSSGQKRTAPMHSMSSKTANQAGRSRIDSDNAAAATTATNGPKLKCRRRSTAS